MIVTIPACNQDEDVTLLSAKLATSFFLESFIHSKEKLNIVQWVELLTKKFDSSAAACRWFLDAMADDSHWLVTIFLKCQVATIRQMFHRICIHVIQKLRATEKDRYLLPWNPESDDTTDMLDEPEHEGMLASKTTKSTRHFPTKDTIGKIGSFSPVTRFVRTVLGLLESGVARPHIKNLSELFRFLSDFSKLGGEETKFLLSVQTISIFVDFYLKAVKQSDGMESALSEEEEDDDDDVIALTGPLGPNGSGGGPGSNEAINRFGSLDKMVVLLAALVEKSRSDEDNLIHLSEQDMNALTGLGPGNSRYGHYQV